MFDQFEISVYKITSDPGIMDKQNHVTPALKREFEKFYPLIQKGNISTIRKLLNLIEKHPNIPQLKNYLAVAYHSSGNHKKALEINNWILKEHPDYFFGLLNKAYQCIEEDKLEKVPEILGKSMELKALYPDRDEFHLSEVTGFLKLAIIYFATIDDFEQADIRMDILTEIAPDHPDTEMAQNQLILIRFEAEARHLEEEEKTKIKVEVHKYDKSEQTCEEPTFNHPEIEWLYQFDSKIAKGKLEKILSLPRETIIIDLTTILKDIIHRYEYFMELEDRGELDDEKHFFGLHAIYLLGELEAEEALDAILETFKLDTDFLHFWYYD